MMKKAVIILTVLAVAIALLPLSLFAVKAGEAAVVTQFGKPVATITEPGLRTMLRP